MTNRSSLYATYAGVLLGPLVLIVGVAKPGAQGRLVVFADAVGFAGLSLMALQVLVSGRWAATTRLFGLRGVLSLHRQAGMAIVALVVLHVVLLMADDPARLALLDPPAAPNRARAGMLAVVGLFVLAGTSAWRSRLGLNYQRWRAVHLAVTSLVLAAAFAHVVWVDAYTSLPVMRWTVLAIVLTAAAGLFWTRVVTPYSTAMRPYRVLAVTRERGNAVTVELEAEGHRGLHFEPGQFARLRTADRCYGIDDHPFTLSSSADRPDRPSFTVKALGDFSTALADLSVGTQVLVDGPHGEAVAPHAVGGRLLVAAGIGITPALSVLRTAADRGDHRLTLLIYGGRHWADITFREELRQLDDRLPNLRVVHVLSRPEPGWRGEHGRVGLQVLRSYAPPDLAAWTALICGPPAMVATTIAALTRLGLPARAIQAEGFE